MTDMTLFDYWRSSASYRVRIALNYKSLPYSSSTVNLLEAQQKSAANLARNPQGLVPTLQIGEDHLTQSLAIIEYLDEMHPEPTLMPKTPRERARVRALAHAIAMDIHPVCNLSVVKHVVELAGGGDATKVSWMQHYIRKGLDAFEEMLSDGQTGQFCHGDQITLADLCLVPQVYNADRWGVDRSHLARINGIVAETEKLSAFQDAAPRQDA